VGAYSVSLSGSNFAPDSVVQANGVDVPTVFVSSTKVVANGVAAAVGTIQFTVRHPAPGAVSGNKVSATITYPTAALAEQALAYAKTHTIRIKNVVVDVRAS
jgi:stringent starvation protein B